jgi:hypothetical protein
MELKGSSIAEGTCRIDDRLRVFLLAMREAGIIFLAAVEDLLDVPYDKSVLAKRRAKVKEMTSG